MENSSILRGPKDSRARGRLFELIQHVDKFEVMDGDISMVDTFNNSHKLRGLAGKDSIAVHSSRSIRAGTRSCHRRDCMEERAKLVVLSAPV